MLGGYVFVAHLLHFLFGLRERRGQLAAGLRLRGGRPARARQRDQRVAHRGADRLRIAASGLDQPLDNPVFLTQQCIHHMQRLNLRIAGGGSALNRVADDFLRHGGELLFHINLRVVMRLAARPERDRSGMAAGAYVCV